MKARIHELVLINGRAGPRRTRLRLTVKYGVQVRPYSGGRWKWAHRDGKPLIYMSEARAISEAKKIGGTLMRPVRLNTRDSIRGIVESATPDRELDRG